MAGALALAVSAIFAAQAQAASIEVFAVQASNPGASPKVPGSLQRFAPILEKMPFQTFTPGGGQTINVGPGQTQAANAGNYQVEVTLRQGATVEVVLSQGGRRINQPVQYNLAPGNPVSMEVGNARAPTVIFLTLKGN